MRKKRIAAPQRVSGSQGEGAGLGAHLAVSCRRVAVSRAHAPLWGAKPAALFSGALAASYSGTNKLISTVIN